MEIYKGFEIREHLQPFILAKISIALAIRNGFKYDPFSQSDTLGLDLNRQTITGEYDLLFKTLIEKNEVRNLTEEEYFPDMLKAYMDEGAISLEQEYKYSNDFFLI